VSESDRILIAGAGPAGLAAALRLAQRDIAVTVVEKRMQLGRTLRPSAWLPPTLEVFEQFGILEGVLRTGLKASRIVCLRAGAPAPVARFDLALLDGETRFPFRLHLDQGAVTAALAARLVAYPHARLAFGAELVRLDQDESGVAVRLSTALGERVERGAYLLAADGAESTVRRALGIGMDGNASIGRLVQVLTPTDLGELVPHAEATSWIQAAGGCCGLLRLPDLWQIAMPVAEGASDDEVLDERALRARLARLLPFGASSLELVGREVRPVRRLVARAYGAGRVLLAGDAAHMVQTRFGFNVNCGLHDAVAGAEVIIAALHTPAAAAALLETYARERRLIATTQLLPQADRAVPGDETWAAEVTEAAADPARARAWLRSASMLDLPGLSAAAVPLLEV
jgi:2-polyprenyl-6-methoxyphenol hydroxylase-like FAD-dependent oxidoreductase